MLPGQLLANQSRIAAAHTTILTATKINMKREIFSVYFVIFLSVISVVYLMIHLSVFSNTTNAIFIILTSALYLAGVLVLVRYTIIFLKEYNQATSDRLRVSFEQDLFSNLITSRPTLLSVVLPEIRSANENYARNAHSAISIISSILVTVGFLGTIAGLTLSFSGIKEVLSAIDSKDEIITGMYDVLFGVDVAFYTTIFGAFLGGISLKVCSVFLAAMANRVLAVYKANVIKILVQSVDTWSSAQQSQRHANDLLPSIQRAEEEINKFVHSIKTLSVNVSSLADSVQANRLELILNNLQANVELTNKAILLYQSEAEKG